MSLVIVAVPEIDDIVWKISSEKIPHMTLLFLGDDASMEQVNRIQDYIQHSVNIKAITRFGANVERRGVLGADEADVVFFDKRYNMRKVEEFRSALLQQPDIKVLYNSVEQFSGWTPHLTLGYPTAPAHADTRDYPGVNYVTFDKIALWVGDFSGLEFELSTNDDMELSMSTTVEGVLSHFGVKEPTATDKFLEHFGVKGMKWGVRKDRGGSSGPQAVVTRSKPGQRVTASGGGGRLPHEDAKRAVALAQKAKSSTTHSLSNEELKDLLTRLDLESRYTKLNPPKATVKGFIAKQLAAAGQQELKKVMQGDLTRINQIEQLIAGGKTGKHRKK